MNTSSKLKFVFLLTALGLLLYASPTSAAGKQCWTCPIGFFEAVSHNTCCKSGAMVYCAESTDPIDNCLPGESCQLSDPGNIFSGTCVAGGATPTPPPGATPTPAGGGCSGTDIPTGLGCIPTDPTGLVNKILQIAIGVSSGIAMLLLISGAFKVLTSSGDPKAVMDGKETITSAIAGLLLILLSVAILNIIGIQILGIPIWK